MRHKQIIYSALFIRTWWCVVSLSYELYIHSSNPPFLNGGGIDYTKNPSKQVDEKIARGDSAVKEGDAVSLGIFVAGVWKM